VRFQGKVAFITGAGSGIGRATAVRLAAEGATVAVHDRLEAAARETVDAIRAAGGEAAMFLSDVSDVAATQGAIADAERTLGPIDILVNNAGITSDFCTLEEVTEDMFDKSIATHAKGTLFATQAVVRSMKARGGGKIVNVSSISGTVGNPMASTYNAAKGAIAAMTKGWAKEFAKHGILVNAIAPGPTITPMTTNRLAPDYFTERAKDIPLSRWGTAEDMAGVIVFLASPDADYMTGQIVSPNGGLVII
jgi:NAD(P)-dependent dehydrogenase (short-subunit alcohol dehydrogenase family)